ncbi:hypothetical protein B0H13DRAFT_2503494 [Mycena leptocephala]|nr:hypothetical protein B0H13DRAFT_2503494 [Mycena leptocephala]
MTQPHRLFALTTIPRARPGPRSCRDTTPLAQVLPFLQVFRWRLFSSCPSRLPTLPPGYNHSGKLGQINFLDGVMGYANAQRMLDDIRVIVDYLQAHNMIRGITGYSAGYGPFISIRVDFQGTASWAGFLLESDRIILDNTYMGSCLLVFARRFAHTFVYTLHLPPRSSRSIVLYLSLYFLPT